MKKHHLMVSIVADQINEALFDEIGDDVIEFNQDDQPAIIEDYRADLEKMFSDKE
ncbi:tellurite resistance TerB C-terminal domain-containing protein [Limosilactobacillus panis]|uniref:tellurite resistance TerB C-terminal domain-containing protein n=1 Tax=Limosilactobacillus panis TaxID=47493 RepID=UPI00128B580E|nr:tellurite resistance TerB C-terminal domain-containing protein [Limosilactobacillus panis]